MCPVEQRRDKTQRQDPLPSPSGKRVVCPVFPSLPSTVLCHRCHESWVDTDHEVAPTCSYRTGLVRVSSPRVTTGGGKEAGAEVDVEALLSGGRWREETSRATLGVRSRGRRVDGGEGLVEPALRRRYDSKGFRDGTLTMVAQEGRTHGSWAPGRVVPLV